MSSKQLTVCIPTYKRYQMTVEAVNSALQDSRIIEVVVVEDGLTEETETTTPVEQKTDADSVEDKIAGLHAQGNFILNR